MIPDTQWQEISASRRAKSLYVKMPLFTARLLLVVLEVTSNLAPPDERKVLTSLLLFLKDQIRKARRPPIIYRLTLEAAKRDIRAFQSVGHLDASGLVRKFCRTLEAGMRNDPEVDWFSRTGGPPAEKLSKSQRPVLDFSLEQIFS